MKFILILSPAIFLIFLLPLLFDNKNSTVPIKPSMNDKQVALSRPKIKMEESELGVANFLSNLLGLEEPNDHHYYNLNMTQVMQSAKDGVLIKVNPIFTMGEPINTEVAFLYTDRDFIDGTGLDNLWAAYVGIYQYQTVLGGVKKIHAFRLIEDDEIQTFKKSQQEEPNFISVNGKVIPNPQKT